MYLLDTNVVSELRKGKKADSNVRSWATRVPASSLFVSVITILELETGVRLIERRDTKQGAILRRWMDEYVLPAFDERVLAIDVAVALECARLHVPDRRAERDALIAATAVVHRLQIVTRNVEDFESTGPAVINPWS